MDKQKWQEICDHGIVNGGNLYRFGKLLTRAENGEHLKVGFLGGSITQGSLASTPQKCYAYLVYSWLKEHFPDAQWEYINAGIGATTSQFGVARVERDLLRHEPDIVFLEYSVNDMNNEFFKESFEGVVRKTLTAEPAWSMASAHTKPALFMFNNVQYNDGINAEEVHNEIGRAYGLPIVTMKASIYAEIAAGRLQAPEITPDNLHPNDKGHRMVADVICNLLGRIFCAVSGGKASCAASGIVIDDERTGAGHFVVCAEGRDEDLALQKDSDATASDAAASDWQGDFPAADAFGAQELSSLQGTPYTRNIPFTQDTDTMPGQPVTKNRFITAVRYQNPDFADAVPGKETDEKPNESQNTFKMFQTQTFAKAPAGVQLRTGGFTPDPRPQEYGVADVFKNGWRAMEEGSFFEITFDAVSSISVQFCRTVKQPAPVAKAVIDGDEAHAVVLDANFDETWGDCASLKDIAMWMPRGKHTLRITITQKPKQPENDFYLISVIAV